MNKLWIVLLIMLSSCGAGRSSKLDEVDNILIEYKEGISFQETNELTIDGLLEVLKEEPEFAGCKADGSISFRKKQEVILKADFARTSECLYLLLNENSENKAYRLNYRSGMYLNELYYNLTD